MCRKKNFKPIREVFQNPVTCQQSATLLSRQWRGKGRHLVRAIHEWVRASTTTHSLPRPSSDRAFWLSLKSLLLSLLLHHPLHPGPICSFTGKRLCVRRKSDSDLMDVDFLASRVQSAKQLISVQASRLTSGNSLPLFSFVLYFPTFSGFPLQLVNNLWCFFYGLRLLLSSLSRDFPHLVTSYSV